MCQFFKYSSHIMLREMFILFYYKEFCIILDIILIHIICIWCIIVRNCVWFQQKKNIKSHDILIYFSTANVQVRLKLNLQKQHIKYIKVGFFCHLLSLFCVISAVVLILLLEVCESEQFTMAEHNKSQK